MNEVLAIVVFAFFAERIHPDYNLDALSAEEVGEQGLVS